MAESVKKDSYYVIRKCRPQDVKGEPQPYLKPGEVVEMSKADAQVFLDQDEPPIRPAKTSEKAK